MRTQRIAMGVALAMGGFVAQGAAFADEYRGTMEQQMACTPDVWRLCSDQIPDVNRIVACLQQNTPQLSSGCRAVFQSNNRMAPQPVPRGRMVQQPRGTGAPPVAAPVIPGDDDQE
jgi:hypothetical protein